jgi:hypothetical protein
MNKIITKSSNYIYMRNAGLEFETSVTQSMKFTDQFVLQLEDWRLRLLSCVSHMQFCNII